MAGVQGMRTGGANKKSAAEHALNGSFRADRHAPKAFVTPVRGRRKPPRGASWTIGAVRSVWKQIHVQYDLNSAPSLELFEARYGAGTERRRRARS